MAKTREQEVEEGLEAFKSFLKSSMNALGIIARKSMSGEISYKTKRDETEVVTACMEVIANREYLQMCLNSISEKNGELSDEIEEIENESIN